MMSTFLSIFFWTCKTTLGRGYGGKGNHCPMLLSEIVGWTLYTMCLIVQKLIIWSRFLTYAPPPPPPPPHEKSWLGAWVWVPTNVFSHFYTPTLAVFRKINDRFRLSQNFEKRDFIMFPLTVLVSKPPNLTYSNCHFIKDFEENYLVLRFLWLSRMYLMLVKRWFVFVKYVRHNDGAKLA